MTHIIQKQILELTLDEGPDQKVTQDDFALRLANDVLPALDDLFEELVPAEITFEIDSIEIDLGQNHPNDFKNEIIRQLRGKLKFAFPSTHDEKPSRTSTADQNLIEQFLFFLGHGHFSWTANGVDLQQMEVEIPKALTTWSAKELQQLFEKLSRPDLLARFSTQFSVKFQTKLLQKLIPVGEEARLLKQLRSILPKNALEHFPAAVLSSYRIATHPFLSVPFLTKLIQELEFRQRFTVQEKKQFRAKIRKQAIQKNILEAEIKEAISKLTLEKIEPPKEGDHGDNPTLQTLEPIYIENAGLVLLWPYLQRFFENLKLVSEGEFISRRAREKAACLLQSLVDHENEITENQLPLNKILCGMKVQELLPTSEIKITNEAIIAGDELIEAVIKNWSKLGNTSVQGFQTSFLQREGRLENTEDGWKLLVEQRSFDMLLDSLPYTINLIKLPWMPEAIEVKW